MKTTCDSQPPHMTADALDAASEPPTPPPTPTIQLHPLTRTTRPTTTSSKNISTTYLAIIYSYLNINEIHISLVVSKSWRLDETGLELLRHLLRAQLTLWPYTRTTTVPTTVKRQVASLIPPVSPPQSIQRTAFDPSGSIELLQKAAADYSLGPFNLEYERLPWRQQASWIRYSFMSHRIIRLHTRSIPVDSFVLGGSRELLGSGVLLGANEIWNGIHHQVLHVYLDPGNDARTYDSISSTQLQVAVVLQWLQSSCSHSSADESAADEFESFESRLIVLTVIDDNAGLSCDHTSFEPFQQTNDPPLTLAFSAGQFDQMDDAQLELMTQPTPSQLLLHSFILTTQHRTWCRALLTCILTDNYLAHPTPTNDYPHVFAFIRQFYGCQSTLLSKSYQATLPTTTMEKESSLDFIVSILNLCAGSVPRPIRFQLFYLDLGGGVDIFECMRRCLFPYHSSCFSDLKELYLFHLTGVFPSVSFSGPGLPEAEQMFARPLDDRGEPVPFNIHHAFNHLVGVPPNSTNHFPKVIVLFLSGDRSHSGCYLDDATLRMMFDSFRFVQQIELFHVLLDDTTRLSCSYLPLTHLNLSDCAVMETFNDGLIKFPAHTTVRYQHLTWLQLPEAIIRQLKLRWKRIQPSIRRSLQLYYLIIRVLFGLMAFFDIVTCWIFFHLFTPDIRWFEWMIFFIFIFFVIPYLFYLTFAGESHLYESSRVNQRQILGPSLLICLVCYGPILIHELTNTPLSMIDIDTFISNLYFPISIVYLSYHICHLFCNSLVRPSGESPARPRTWPMTIYLLHDYLLLHPLQLYLIGLNLNWLLPPLSQLVWQATHLDVFTLVQLIYTYVLGFDLSHLISTIQDSIDIPVSRFDPTSIFFTLIDSFLFLISSSFGSIVRFWTLYLCLLSIPILWQSISIEHISRTCN